MPRRPDTPDSDVLGGEPPPVLRRAPFSTNPTVGVRGQRAQQRILEAALQVFGEVGYHDCGIVGITERAGCSRAAFYQYFSSKEDVFRQLAGQVARQLLASAEAMAPVTPDADGWRALRAWIQRHGEIHARYRPVFRAYQAAAESDDAVASGSSRVEARTVATVRSKLATTTLPARHVDAVIATLQQTATRTRFVSDVLRGALPAGTHPTDRIDDALTDVVHRTLFGLDADVNVRPPARRRPPRVRQPAATADASPTGGGRAEPGEAGARTLALLLDAGREVLVARGYHGTRVDDVVAAAEVSHGTFYRYFDDKDDLARVLAGRATRHVYEAFDAIPDPDGAPSPAFSSALRRWLRRYHAAYASETALIRVWVDATTHDPGAGAEAPAAIDWGRRRFVRWLEPRGFGDVETEALVAVALVDAFGARPGDRLVVDATAHVVERGLLGC